jgi:serine/threonine-protein kinase
MEIGHVLFMDLVGYSKLLLNDQRELQEKLTQIVRETEQVRAAEATGKLIRLPSGDGMALVFLSGPEAPVQCALEIGRAAKLHPEIQLRMGIHSGPINQLKDVNDRTNIAGAGINMAQRVMDCADAGHILLSKRVAEDLAQSRQWQPHLHDLGECSVKHGVNVSVVNLYTGDLGNPHVPERIRKSQAEQAARQPPATLRRRNVLLAAAVPVVILLAAGLWFFLRQTAAASEKSIAVLPFENFSDDKQNAFFADGIQDDILTSLAKIGDLKVISRSSVMQYRGVGRQNLREIGKKLGVVAVLEGSVRREGERMVVNVQLIDARNDQHLWAERYDRTLADSLGLQGELATEIASRLSATLSPEEKARMERKPTNNADAYVLYLHARQLELSPDTLLQDYRAAEQLYSQAIRLDPAFALAHARLASTCAEVYHFHEPLESWDKRARAEAAEALRLQPNLSEGHFALGQCYFWMDLNYEAALKEFAFAARLAPNSTEPGQLVAAVRRRQGRWQESLNEYERIGALDPQNPNVARNLLITNTALRRWPEAMQAVRRWQAIAPDSVTAKIQAGYLNFWWKGDTRALKELLAKIPPGTDPDGIVTCTHWEVAMIERDFATAAAVLQNSSAETLDYLNSEATPKTFFEGCILLAQGNAAAAREKFEQAREKSEVAVRESSRTADRHSILGLVYAFMGDKEDAVREGRRAVELMPESKDAFDGAIVSCFLALIYARVGETDQALTLIERLIKTPGAVDSAGYSMTVNDLKHRWEWDPIRNDPRFQKLMAQGP